MSIKRSSFSAGIWVFVRGAGFKCNGRGMKLLPYQYAFQSLLEAVIAFHSLRAFVKYTGWGLVRGSDKPAPLSEAVSADGVGFGIE